MSLGKRILKEIVNIRFYITRMLKTFQNANFKVQCICVESLPWFRGKDVATILGYSDTSQAIRVNVDSDDKKKMRELGPVSNTPLDANAKNSMYINESGLYSLILRSEKPEAKIFKKWVTSEVLPEIRKTGSYVAPAPPPPPAIVAPIGGDFSADRSFTMQCENDLHSKVVDYIRRFYPHAKMTAGLGEFQTTSSLRVEGYRKGYQKGTADLMILNKHLDYSGLCIEFKTPNGKGSLSEAQSQWLRDLHLNGHKVLLSNDYDSIVRAIDSYFLRVRIACPHCLAKPVYYKTEATLQQHIMTFHRRK
jgi:hypothetical protein